MSRLRVCLLAAGLFIAVCALYAPVAGFEFVNFDDNVYVAGNPLVVAGISAEGLRWSLQPNETGHWHPLTWLSHMLDCELWGLDAGAHHVVNLLWHAASAVLLFLLLWRLSARAWPALAAALLFAAHPLRVESVAWISERKDVLSVALLLVSAHAYVAYVRRRALWCYGAVLVTLALSLLAKPTAMTAPVLFLLLDGWPLNRWATEDRQRLVLEKVSMALLGLGSAVVVTWAQGAAGALRTADVALGVRLANAAASTVSYLGMTLWPANLAVFYPFEARPTGLGVGCALALVAMTVVLWRCRERALWFGWLWFLVALLPVIGIVQVGWQLLADRWTYLPHLGLLAGGTAFLADRLRPRLAVTVVCCAIVALALQTRRQLEHWRSSETLFEHAVAVTERNFLAHTNLGQALDAQGRTDAARTHYERAIGFNPTYPEALNNLGSIMARNGELREAQAYFWRALQRQPSHTVARYNLGLSYAELDDAPAAVVHWVDAWSARAGSYPEALASLGFVLAQQLPAWCSVARPWTSSVSRPEVAGALARLRSSDFDPALWPAISGCAAN